MRGPGGRSRKIPLLLYLFFTALFFWIYADLFIRGTWAPTWDIFAWSSILSYFYDSLREGVWPLWAPYVNGGQPFYYLAPQLRLYEPATVLLMLAGGALDLSAWAVLRLDLAWKILFGCTGVAALAGHFARCRLTAPLVYGITLLSAVPFQSVQNYGMLDVYPLPWCLFFFHRLAGGTLSARNVFFFAYFLASCFANYRFPAPLWTLSLYFLLYLATHRGAWARLHPPPGGTPQRMILFAITCAGILAPLLDLYFQQPWIVATTRTITSSISDTSIQVTSGPKGLVQFFMTVPAGFFCPGWFFLYFQKGHLFGCPALTYIGLLPAWCAVLAVFAPRPRIRWTWIGLIALLSVLIVGEDSIVAGLSYSFFPGFSYIRFLSLFHTHLLLFLVLLASIGLDRILLLAERSPRLYARLAPLFLRCIFVFSALSVGAAAFGFTAHRLAGTYQPDELQYAASRLIAMHCWSILLLLCGWALLVLRAKRRVGFQGFVSALLAILAIDLGTFQMHFSKYYQQPIQDTRPAAHLVDGFPFRPMRVAGSPYPETLLVEGKYKDFLGYLQLLEKQSYARTAPVRNSDIHLVDMKAYDTLVNKVRDPQILRNLFCIDLPVARLVRDVHRETEDRFLEHLQGSDAVRLSTQVTVHGSAGQQGTEGDFDKSIEPKLVHFDTNSATFETESPFPGFLYYGDGYHPGWRVWVDGKEQPIVRSNYAFKGVSVPEGKHRVRFYFRPVPFLCALWMFYLTHAAAAVGAMAWLLERRKTP